MVSESFERFDLYKRGYTAELPVVGGLLEPYIFIVYLVSVVFCLYFLFLFLMISFFSNLLSSHNDTEVCFDFQFMPEADLYIV